jgi:homoserine kinase type II
VINRVHQNSRTDDIVVGQKDIFTKVKRMLGDHYDIGRLIRKKKILRGYINESYIIEMVSNGKKNRYLLRRYRQGTSEEKIKFEHALLEKLQKRGFQFTPRLVTTKEGETFIHAKWCFKDKLPEDYIAILSYLPGKDKYTWDAPNCSEGELKSAAGMLALYHDTIYNWQGITKWKEKTVFDEVKLLAQRWRKHAQHNGQSPFDIYFLDHFDTLLKMLDRTMPRSVYYSIPHLAIHGDYHPGNLKFQNEKVTGVFDFDWSKMDSRCFDVGLAVVYFCVAWKGAADGDLELDRAGTFLKAYQEAAGHGGELGPLNALEMECLPGMIHMGNLWVLNWTLDDFYNLNPDPLQYLKYLRHGVRSGRWLERNFDVLTNYIQEKVSKKTIGSLPQSIK